MLHLLEQMAPEQASPVSSADRLDRAVMIQHAPERLLDRGRAVDPVALCDPLFYLDRRLAALNPVTPSAPVPRAVPDMQDYDYVFHYAVGSDVGQEREDQLARAGLLSLASAVRGIDQALAAVVNDLRPIAGRCGIIHGGYTA